MTTKKAKEVKTEVTEEKIEMPEVEQPVATPIIEPSTTDNANTGRLAKKAGKIILGIIITLVGIAGVYFFWPSFLVVLKGVIGVIVILIGLIIIALGWTD